VPGASKEASASRRDHRGWWPWLLAGAVLGAVAWLQVRVIRSR
jgi:hypothetical protein